MPAQPSGRYLLRPPRPSGSALGRLRARRAAGNLFSCQQRGKMHCQNPDREPKTKVFRPGQQRHRVPVPGSSPRCPRPGGGAARDDRAGQGDPGPPTQPLPRSHHRPYQRGDPPAAVSGSAPARPRGSRGVPHRPRRDSPGTRPRGSRRLRGKLRKLQRDRRGGRDQRELRDHARGCGSNDPPKTPQSQVPATSGGGAHRPLPEPPGRSRESPLPGTGAARPAGALPPPRSCAPGASFPSRLIVPRHRRGQQSRPRGCATAPARTLRSPRSSAHLRRGGTRRPAGPCRLSPLPAPRPAPDSPALRLHGALTLPVLGSPSSSSSSSFAAPWRGRGARGPHRHRTRQAPQAHRARSPQGPAFPQRPHPPGRHILPRRDSTSSGAPMGPIHCPTSPGTIA